MPDMTARLLIVDDHEAIAQALASAFVHVGFDAAVHVPYDELTVDGVLAAADAAKPEVALVDLHLGGGRSGLSVIGPLVGRGIRVVAMSARDDALAPAESVEAGACGFMHKAEPFRNLVAYVERVAKGEDVIPVAVQHELRAQARANRGDDRLQRFAALTGREREVLHALVQGRTANEIASDGGVSVRTVRKQIEQVRQKLDVGSQLAAVALARETGWRFNAQ